TKTTPTNASGRASGAPRCTAPTRMPIAIAKAAGRTPRDTSTAHHAAASAASARARTAKSFHSFRSRQRRSTAHSAPEAPVPASAARRLRANGYLYHSATPPCLEQAPRCCFAYEYVPSLHFAVAFSGALAADAVGAFAGVWALGGEAVFGAGAGGGGVGGAAFDPAAAGDEPPNHVFTPPCCEQAPRSVFARV